MIRLLSAASLFALLAACDNAQPFTFGDVEDEASDETEETVAGEDPNETPNSLFAFDGEFLTMNRVEYDADNDILIINNLPYDGPGLPGGAYDFYFEMADGERFYENRQTAIDGTPDTGIIKHYAAFVRTDQLEAVAAAGVEWLNFGYGGANVNRTTYTLPADGEYVYLGTYAGVRTFDDRAWYELVEADAIFWLDVNDFDPNEDIQGSVLARIQDRRRVDGTWGSTRALPSISLRRTSFNAVDGTWLEGEAQTFDLEGDPLETGNWEGVLAGSGSSDAGGFVVIDGPANEQRVFFEIAHWSLTQDVTRNILGIEVTTTETTTGTAEGLTENNEDQVQTLIDRGITVPLLEYNSVDIPPGASVTRVETDSRDFITDFNAREIGVFAVDRLEGESIPIP